MSNFTSDIGGVNNRIRVQDPGPKGPSFIDFLAESGSGALEAAGVIRQRNQRKREEAEAARRQAEADRRQAEADALESSKDDIAFSALTDRMYEGEALRQSQLPSDVIETTRSLKMTEEGVRQGRIPRSRANIRLESSVRRILNENPTQASEILSYMRQEGLTGRFFQELTFQEEREEYERQTALAYERQAENTAIENIAPENLGATREERVRQGQQLQVYFNQKEMARQEAAEARAQASQDMAAARFRQDRASQAAFRASSEFLSSVLRPQIDSLLLEINSGKLDSGAARLEAVKNINQVILGARSRLTAEFAGVLDPEAWANVERQLDSYQETMNWALTSDDSTEIVRGIEARYNMSVADSLGPIMVLKSAIGEQGVANLLAPSMTASMMENGELQRAVDNLMNNAAMPNDIVAIQESSKQYNKILSGIANDEDVRKMGPVLLDNDKRTTKKVLEGNELAKETFKTEYPALLKVTGQAVFQRGMTDSKKAEKASETLFGPDRRKALQLLDDPGLNKTASVFAERALYALKGGVESRTLVGSKSDQQSRIKFDKSLGYFTAKSKEVNIKDFDLDPTSSAFYLSQARMNDTLDQEAKETVAALNTTLDFLTEFGGKEGDPRELRAFWAGEASED